MNTPDLFSIWEVTTYRPILLILVFMTTTLTAHTEIKEDCSFYGQCTVCTQTQTDPFTNQTSFKAHTLSCGFGTVQLGLECNSILGEFAFLLSREITQLPTIVFVRMKFDEGVVYKGIWLGSERLAFFSDSDVVEYVATGIMESDSIMYEIAGEISKFSFQRSHGGRAVRHLIPLCHSLKD